MPHLGLDVQHLRTVNGHHHTPIQPRSHSTVNAAQHHALLLGQDRTCLRRQCDNGSGSGGRVDFAILDEDQARLSSLRGRFPGAYSSDVRSSSSPRIVELIFRFVQIVKMRTSGCLKQMLREVCEGEIKN
ncbi:unnamed protein product [Cercospora beticola]|nr:unnamed protein product [Cercospora beticola]